METCGPLRGASGGSEAHPVRIASTNGTMILWCGQSRVEHIIMHRMPLTQAANVMPDRARGGLGRERRAVSGAIRDVLVRADCRRGGGVARTGLWSNRRSHETGGSRGLIARWS